MGSRILPLVEPIDGAAYRVIGVPRPRVDSADKVAGVTRFAADIPVPGLLHARIVPSVYAHARIRAIDTAAALAIPGVVAVLTARDLPIVDHGEGRIFESLAASEAVFAGQPVALVVARSEAIAEDAVEAVVVDAERLPPAVDLLAASEPGAPSARLDAPDEGNVLARYRETRGDAAAAMAACDVVVEGRFVVPWAYQGYLEPHAATAWVDADGTLVVSTSTQGLFDARDLLARLFGLPPTRVRVTVPPVGGGFGSKEVLIEPLVAGAALRLRAPVRLVLTRSEDLLATNPSQGMIIDLRLGADRTGRFGALEASVWYDRGAYPDGSWEWFAHRLLTGPYRWPAFDVTAIGVRTNRFGAGHYRAPSGPQGLFALESLVDELAAATGRDPVDLRLANAVGVGDEDADGHPWPRIGLAECLGRLREDPLWRDRERLPPGEGVGLAVGVWSGSAQPAAATCRLERDGTLTLITGVVDLGGSLTGLAAIAAETFGVALDDVSVVVPSSDAAPPTPGTNASAITYGVGPAVQAAAAEARARLLAVAADELEIAAGDLEIVDGVVRPRDVPGAGRAVADLASGLADSFGSPHPPIEGHGATAHRETAPSAIGHLAHVRVDPETGAVTLLGYVVVQDVGRALNPALVEGQIIGGAVQSIGRALVEALVHDGEGQLLTGTFLDYALPRASMLPQIKAGWVEVPAPEGPFGAKGIGEASILAGPAAIANAVAAATGVRLRELPMTPDRVWRAMRS